MNKYAASNKILVYK